MSLTKKENDEVVRRVSRRLFKMNAVGDRHLMSLTKKENDEVVRRVSRRLFKMNAVGDRDMANSVAASELTQFYREKAAGSIAWTKPTFTERIGHVLSRLFGS